MCLLKCDKCYAFESLQALPSSLTLIFYKIVKRYGTFHREQIYTSKEKTIK